MRCVAVCVVGAVRLGAEPAGPAGPAAAVCGAAPPRGTRGPGAGRSVAGLAGRAAVRLTGSTVTVGSVGACWAWAKHGEDNVTKHVAAHSAVTERDMMNLWTNET